MELIETRRMKTLISEDYNYTFDKVSGTFHRWGANISDDPEYSKYGPEIADIEISTICSNGCKFCYKSNTCVGTYMNFETFRKVFEKLPKTVTQIAFGIGDIDANPDMYKIMRFCRLHGVIPNVTINGSRMKDSDYEMLSRLCGAVAVSLYDFDTCKNAIVNLGKRGMHQVNIHCLLSEETFDKCMDIAKKADSDPLLRKYLNAIVFLWLKPKGERNTYHQVSKEHYETLIKYLKEKNVRFGFDSCSAPKVMEYMPEYSEYIEPCESTLFSIYINVEGKAYPCSFSENENGYNGVDIIGNDFMIGVWNSNDFCKFRESVIGNKDHNGCRNCPLFELRMC